LLTSRRSLGHITMAAWMLGLTACAVGPDFQPLPPAKTPQLAQENLLRPGTGLSQQAIPLDWWALFHDSTLNALIAEADKANLDVLLASLRVEESRAEEGLVEAQQQPQLGFGAGFTRQAISAKSPLAHLGASTYAFDQWQQGFQASWEVDLWGHLRRLGEAARARLAASAYEREAVRISVTAEVARNYFQLRGTQIDAALSSEATRLAAETVALTQSRIRNGTASASELERALASQAEAQARTQQLELQRATLMNALALLLGKDPQQLNTLLAKQPAHPLLPAQIPTGLPSELARNRPDIRQAEARLHAAIADTGAAQADFYPRVKLTGAIGSQAFTGRDLGMWQARQFSFGPSLYLPLFDGGRLQRNLELSETRQRMAALAYKQTVLRAWHEIDNQLNRYRTTQQQQQQHALASNQYQQAFNHARVALQLGVADRLSLISAQQTMLASQQALSDSSTTEAIAIVDLYKALGSGWNNAADKPSEKARP